LDKGPLEQLVAEVKARTDLVALVTRDIELKASGDSFVGRSLKNVDRTPSLRVWKDRWRDYSGGGAGGGDAIDFVRYARGCSFIEALRMLAGEAGLSMPGVSSEEAAAQLRRFQERRRLEELLTSAATYFHGSLPERIRREVYRERYGYTDETIDELKLGFGWSGLMTWLAGKCGATEEEALSTGLFAKTAGGIEETFWGRAVFPYWRGGRVVYFIGRRTMMSSDTAEWDRPKYRKLPCRAESRPYISSLITNEFFFGEDDARTDGDLLICEGIADAISAKQAGFACISPVTTTFRAQDHEKLLRLTARAKRITIANDCEDSGAGEKGALETARVLHAAGRDVRLAKLPRPPGVTKVDVNDVVREHGPDALRRIVAGAQRLPEYLFERVPKETPAGDLATALAPVFEAARSLGPLDRSDLFGRVAERFGLGKRALAQQFGQFQRAQSSAAPAASPTGLPAIVVNGRQHRDLIDEAARVLVAANTARIETVGGVVPGAGEMPLLFARAGRLVGLWFEYQQPRLVELHDTAMYGLLLRTADWLVRRNGPNGDVLEPAIPPQDVPKDLLAFPPAGLAPIDAIVATPVFGHDGALLARPGYHPGERLWLHLDPRLGTIEVPTTPSAGEVTAARALFETELFHDFPFVDAGDRAHAIAALLLPFARRLVEGCTPLHVVEAPTAGSGKGMLANLIGVVATGQVCDARSLPGVEEECRKMLTAELASGRPIVLLDNLSEKRVLDSPALASVLTAEVWRDRVLGESRMVTLPNTAVWLAAANNPRFSLELARRCIRIRIDPKRDMPWRRGGFRHDPLLGWARQQRPALVRAALTLVQAWLVAGRPQGQQRLGSYEGWSAVMGGILGVAGIDGFLGNLDAFYEAADDEGEAWRAFTRAWWQRHGPRPVRVADLNEQCAELELLDGVRGEGTPKSQQTRLGRALQTARDRVFGGLRVVLVRDGGNKGKQYALVMAEKPAAIDHAVGTSGNLEGNLTREVPPAQPSIPQGTSGSEGNLGEPLQSSTPKESTFSGKE
jgi:DNA primase catalytic core